MASQPSDPQRPEAASSAPGRWRVPVARLLTVLGVLVGVVGILASYVAYEALDTDQFTETSRRLIADDEIRGQVASAMVEELYANVDVSSALEERLPADQQGLAGPIAAALRASSDRLANTVLERPRTQELWVTAAATSHRAALAFIEDGDGALSSTDGRVTLDTRALVLELANRLGLSGERLGRFPAQAGEITLFEAKELESAQNLVAALKFMDVWLGILALALFAAAVWVAKGRRRIELRAIAIGFIVVGVLLLVVRSLAGQFLIESLVEVETVRPAAENTWAILTSALRDDAWRIAAIGLIALAGVWLVGPGRRAESSLRALRPYLGRADLTYGAFALVWLLLLWWSPTVHFRRPLDLILMLVLSGVGLEALRRIAARRSVDAGVEAPALGAAGGPRPTA